MKQLLLTQFLFLFSLSISFGQFSVSGTVVNQDGEPLIGASINAVVSKFKLIASGHGWGLD